MSIHHTGLPFDFEPDEVIRTHANIVLLHGDRAYKLKKPVKFPFLDYSTLEQRRRNVQAEHDLNRRFSPQIYLGVCDVVRAGDKLTLGEIVDRLAEPGDEVVDYAVVMRRIPDDCWLPARIRKGLPSEAIPELVRLLVKTWDAHPADAATRAAGMPENLRHNTVANIAECERFVPDCLSRESWERLDRLLRDWFERNQDTLVQRVKDDRIRDGHGDLKPSNIAILDGHPVVTDCIEFNPQFRRLDTLAEAGFLATGLEQLGEFALAAEVFREYRQAAQDDYPEELRRYYQAHLACVMGKVTALQLDDPEISPQQRAHATRVARHNFALADFHAREPHVILVGGVVGSGKSTLAGELSARLGWQVVSSDVERKRLAGVPATERLPASAYTDESAMKVYDVLARAVDSAGMGVILDGTFAARAFRAKIVEKTRRRNARVTMLLCDAPDDVLRERLRARKDDPARISDADESLLEQSRRRFEPVGDEGIHVIRLDTRRKPGQAADLLMAHLLGPDFDPATAS